MVSDAGGRDTARKNFNIPCEASTQSSQHPHMLARKASAPHLWRARAALPKVCGPARQPATTEELLPSTPKVATPAAEVAAKGLWGAKSLTDEQNRGRQGGEAGRFNEAAVVGCEDRSNGGVVYMVYFSKGRPRV